MDSSRTGLVTGTGESDAMTSNEDFSRQLAMQNLERLTRIEEKINSSNTSFGQWTTSVSAIHLDLEQRVRALERWRWSLPMTFLASLVSAITTVYIATKGGG